jgi:hypothetical protein
MNPPTRGTFYAYDKAATVLYQVSSTAWNAFEIQENGIAEWKWKYKEKNQELASGSKALY